MRQEKLTIEEIRIEERRQQRQDEPMREMFIKEDGEYIIIDDERFLIADLKEEIKNHPPEKVEISPWLEKAFKEIIELRRKNGLK